MEHATVAVNIYCRAAPRDLTEFDYKIPAPSSDEHFLPAPLRLPQSPIRRMAEEGSEMADRNNGPAIGIDLGSRRRLAARPRRDRHQRPRQPNHPILRRLHRFRAPRRGSCQEPGRQEHKQYSLR
jgi:hypothetical protein